jgi:hypothetical protein
MSSSLHAGGFAPSDLVAVVTAALMLATPAAQAAAADALTAAVGSDGTQAVLSMVSDGVQSSIGDLFQYGRGLVANALFGAVATSVAQSVEYVRSVLPGQPMSALLDKDKATFPTQALAALLNDTMVARKLITYCSNKCENRLDVLTQLDEVLSLPAQAAMATSLTGMAIVRMGLFDAFDAITAVGESYAFGGMTTVGMVVSGSTIAGSNQLPTRSIVGTALRGLVSTAGAAMDAAAPPINIELAELGLDGFVADAAIDAYNQMRYVTVTAAAAQNWAELQSAKIVEHINEALNLIDETRELVLKAVEEGMPFESIQVDARLLDLAREWLVAAREKKDFRMTSLSVQSDRAYLTSWAVLVGRIQIGVGKHKLRMYEAVAFAGERSLAMFTEKRGAFAALCIAWQGVFNLLAAVAYPYEMIETDGPAVAAGTAGITGLIGLCAAVSYVRAGKKLWREFRHGKSAAELEAIAARKAAELALAETKKTANDAKKAAKALLAQTASNQEQILASQQEHAEAVAFREYQAERARLLAQQEKKKKEEQQKQRQKEKKEKEERRQFLAHQRERARLMEQASSSSSA